MTPNELVIGKVYFICGYDHRTYPIPRIDTLVYLGKTLFEDREDINKGEYIFQHPQNYFGKIRPDESQDDDTENEDTGKKILFDDTLPVLKNMDGLIEWLQSLKKDKAAEKIF
jgi:hypothetical protein